MSVTLSLPKEAIDRIKAFYDDCLKESKNPNALLFFVGDGFAITVYKKEVNGLRKVLFQGDEAENEAAIWGYQKETKAKTKSSLKNGQIGSDEVGTGDFFGPVCVVAAYIRESDLPRLKELGVTDSKLLSDEKIREIGPLLIKEFPYSSLSLDNEKYNEVISDGLNLNSIKAKMHNRCLLNLASKFKSAEITQDQFAAPKLYYSYLKGEKEVQRGITFSTKGEKAFPSVALASCIARYSFLTKMDRLSDSIGRKIPLGAGKIVDDFALRLKKEIGLEGIKKFAKANFANFKKLL